LFEQLAEHLYANSVFHEGEPNPTAELMRSGAEAIRALLAESVPAGDQVGWPKCEETADLVRRFMSALAGKLANAERKYGYSIGWMSEDWLDECRAKLRHHVEKGDPRDVAAYCAFLWHHRESTAAPGHGQEEER
jgi:hypothetical protein